MIVILQYGKSEYAKKEFIQLWKYDDLDEYKIASSKSMYNNYMMLDSMKFKTSEDLQWISIAHLIESMEEINSTYLELKIPDAEITEELFMELFMEHMPEVFL